MKESKYTIIRIISFLLIFFCHIFQYYNNSLDSWLNVGVILFFALSGFLYGCKKIENKKEWYITQYKKIIIPYLIIFIIMLLLEIIVLNKNYNVLQILLSMFGLQGNNTISTLSHTWFITYILLCYFITPFLSDIFNNKDIKKKQLLFLIIFFAFIQIFNVFNITNINIAYIFVYVFSYLYSKYKFKKTFIIYIIFILTLPLRIIIQYNLANLGFIMKFEYFIILWNNVFLGLSVFILLLKIKNIQYNKLMQISDKYIYYLYLTHQIFILNSFSLIKYNVLLVISATIISGILIFYLTKLINFLLDYIKQKNDYSKILYYLISFLMISNIFLDIYYINGENVIRFFGITLPTIIRFIIIILILLIYLYKTKKFKFFMVYGFLITVFLILQYITCRTYDNYNLLSEVRYFLVIALPIILCYIVSKIKINNKIISRTIIIVSILISIFIIVPYVFKFGICSYLDRIVEYNIFDWFKGFTPYMLTASKGIFKTSIISGLILLIVPYLFYKFVNNSKFYLLLIVSLVLSAFIIGTRASSIGVLLIFIVCILIYLYFVIIKKDYKFNVIKFLLIILVFILSLILYSFSPSVNRIINDNEKEQKAEKAEEINEEKEDEEDEKDEKDILNYKLVNEEGKILICEDYDNKYLINKIKHFSNHLIAENYIYNRYSYKKDPVFWCNIINDLSLIEQSNSRKIQQYILKRVKTLDHNPYENFFGMGYSRTSSIFNLEKDFLYQYYSIGIVGCLLTVYLYVILLAYACIKVLYDYKTKFTFENCAFILGIACLILFSYLSGNTLDNLCVTLPMGMILGLLLNNINNNDLKRRGKND